MSVEKNQFNQPVGTSLPHWQGALLPGDDVLCGRYCQLEPLDIDKHSDALFTAFCDPFDFSAWTYLAYPAEPVEDKAAFIAYLQAISPGNDPRHYAIIDSETGQAVGTIALMRIDKHNGVIEIGYVTFSARLKRTRIATEAVYLLLKLVFETPGYRRVEWKCNALNTPSKQSALRFGFTIEGLFRQSAVVRGHNRDTAWFSMLDHEFLTIKSSYDDWLAEDNFYPDGRQKAALQARRA
ncbi:MAG: hypothetical protein XXXJIFNMEKO3_03097 [Candidatus Erwinia impunctatus]|nr:hypothetical protein XXXJIFNMEKO_03097 [Culicoides impunctatus]